MPNRMRSSLILIFTISVSLFASLTTLMLALNPPKSQSNFTWRKPLIGSLFALICISGTLAAFFPNRCSETFYLPKTDEPAISEAKTLGNNQGSVALKGHHPDCGRFSAHVISAGEHVYCAACAGLLLGAFITLIGSALYFFCGWDIGQFGFPAVLVGQIGIVLGFIQFRFKGYARTTVNAFFVLAAFLTLVGIDKLTENTLIELYLVVSIVFWLLTRILISQWDHWRICYECELRCGTEKKWVG
jgi:hypothetical protein